MWQGINTFHTTGPVVAKRLLLQFIRTKCSVAKTLIKQKLVVIIISKTKIDRIIESSVTKP